MEIKALLVQWREDSEPPLTSTLYAFSGLGRADLEDFVTIWPSLPEERREQVVRGMLEIAEASFEADFGSVFWICLEDPSDQVRARAIDGLWEDESPALREILLEVLASDPAPEVRSRAAVGLGRFVLQSELGKAGPGSGLRVATALVAAHEDDRQPVEVRRRALESLAFSSRVKTQPLIVRAYHDPERTMRVSALFSMGRSLDPDWAQTVIEETENLDPEMRYEAARACGELELRAAVPALGRMIGDPDPEIQSAAIWALGQIGGDRARQLLMACADSEERHIAEAADEAIAELELTENVLEFPPTP